MRETPIHQSHVYEGIKISRTVFEKGHPRNIPVKLFKNLTSSFGEEDFLRISSCPYSARSPHSPEPCLWTDQNFANTFDKGHQRNIPVKLFQNLTSSFGEDFLRISSCPYIVQEDPIHQSHVFRRIKISQTIFEKGHPRNIPAKLFQNLTSGFEEEDFLRISSCPYSTRSPHSPEPCLWTDQISRTSFEKGHPRNIPVKLFQNHTSGFGEEDFLRISSCPYIDKKATFTRAIFEKGHPRNIPVKLF